MGNVLHNIEITKDHGHKHLVKLLMNFLFKTAPCNVCAGIPKRGSLECEGGGGGWGVILGSWQQHVNAGCSYGV